MSYSEIEQETQDIGWYFTTANDEIGFIASGGGKLPHIINKQNNIYLNHFFDSLGLSASSEFEINPNVRGLYDLGENIDLKKMFYEFVEKSKKGITCFDKSILNDYSDTKYHLVVKSKTPLKLTNLPVEVQGKLKEVILNVDFEMNDKIDIQELL